MKSARYTFLFLALFTGLLFTLTAFVGAEENSIQYPVEELGGCGSKNECKAYCEEAEHMDACIAFGLKHGIVKEDEAKKSRVFAKALQEGGGPGGCTTPDGCREYCENITHIDECLSFADKYGYKDDDIDEARKMAEYLRKGGKTPGGCISEKSCEAYCSDFSHIDECLSFAEDADLKIHDGDEEIDKEHIKKIKEIMERGGTPGGCTSRDGCEETCRSGDHLEECIQFGLEVGFMSPEDAEKIRKTGGKGPGGCTSQSECEAFCNDPANRETCFKFGQEHGLLSEEEVRSARENTEKLQAVLTNTPPEVLECLQKNVGANILEKIKAGELTPGPQIGETLRACFQTTLGGKTKEEAMEYALQGASPEARACVEEKKRTLGDNEGDPHLIFDECFKEFGGPMAPGEEGDGSSFGTMPGNEMHGISFDRIPPEVRGCLTQKLGAEDELNRRLVTGEMAYEEVAASVNACFKEVFGESMKGAPSSSPRPSFFEGDFELNSQPAEERFEQESPQENSSPSEESQRETVSFNRIRSFMASVLYATADLIAP